MNTISISALDTLFFKDGRPFAMGDETWANGVFPPYPSVFYGALRTAYFSEHPHTFPSRETVADPTANLHIRSISLQVKDIAGDYANYYPLPYDCVKLKEDRNNHFFSMQLQKDETASSYPCDYSLIPGDASSDRKVEHIQGGLLDYLSLEKYLKGQGASFMPAKTLSELLISEPKTGIARNNSTKTTQGNDGMLYRVDLRRMETLNFETYFSVSFEGMELPESSLMKIGAEGKAAYFRRAAGDANPVTKPTWSEKHDVIFKVYLSTPAVFINGWYPGWIDASNGMTGTFKGLELKLIAAAVGDYLPIGGYDMKKNRPKPMRRAVPAGSVYYFKLLDGDPKAIIETFHNKAISDDYIFDEKKDSYRMQGFGISFVGVV